MKGFFITGTDTDIGKTTVSALIVSALKQKCKNVCYFKPVQTGLVSDTETVVRLAQLSSREMKSPLYQFPEPLAPHRAAVLNKCKIEIDPIQKAIAESSDTFWIVEGAGGLLVPINDHQTIREIAKALGFPLVIVVSTRLGTINHTLLTVESARAAGCSIAGLVLNGERDPGLAELLKDWTGLPILATIEPLASLDPAHIAKVAGRFFDALST